MNHSKGDLKMNNSRMQTYFNDYELFHQTRGNKITHYFGIPMILFSTLGFISAAGAPIDTLIGIGIMLLLLGFYAWIQPMWGLLFTILVAALYGASAFVPVVWHAVLFVGGWILQGIGHYKYEKKSPAFLKNLTHLLIGPFWIFKNLI